MVFAELEQCIHGTEQMLSTFIEFYFSLPVFIISVAAIVAIIITVIIIDISLLESFCPSYRDCSDFQLISVFYLISHRIVQFQIF